MLFPPGATRRTNAEAVCQEIYDAVIVGGGIAGSIIANELARAGRRVLILEAGPGGDRTLKGYEEYLNRYYATAAKDNQSPYPLNANASMPRSTDARKLTPGQPNTSGYLVQNGPLSTDTTYTRVLGGTTMHWEAKVLRMLPEDFEMRTRFGQAEDWPLDYWNFQKYYELAEREIGVSGDVEDQEEHLGRTFPEGYVYPMRALPLSYLDEMVGQSIDGTEVEVDGKSYALKVRSFPQGRNGIPNPDYDGGKGYVPVGAVSTNQVEIGGRCQGNNNCVPICPVQAKYNANKTLAKALQTGRVDLLAQSVASRVRVHRPGWLKTRGFRVSDNRNPLVLRLSDFTETLENKGSHPMNAYPPGSTSIPRAGASATSSSRPIATWRRPITPRARPAGGSSCLAPTRSRPRDFCWRRGYPTATAAWGTAAAWWAATSWTTRTC